MHVKLRNRILFTLAFISVMLSQALFAQDFNFSQSVLDEAMARGMTEYRYSGNWRTEMGGTDGSYQTVPYINGGTTRTRLQGGIYTTKAIAYMAMVAYFEPNARASNGVKAADKVVQHLKYIITDNHEPSCRGGGISGHADGSLVSAIVLAKMNPAIWNQFSAREIDRIDWLMRFFTAAANFSQNRLSPYEFGVGISAGNYRKTMNPNLVYGVAEMMINAYYYFGGKEAVNSMLASFNWQQWMAKAQSLGYATIKRQWETAGKRSKFKGYANIERHIRNPYTYGHVYPRRPKPVIGGPVEPFVEPDNTEPRWYKSLRKPNGSLIKGELGHPAVPYEPFELNFSLSLRQFYHVATDRSPSGAGYQLGQGKSTPVKGRQGMCYELNGADEGGTERTDLKYVHESLNTSCYLHAIMYIKGDLFDGASDKVAAMKSRMYVGWTDFFYKARWGWYSYQNGGGPYHKPVYGNDLVDRGFNFTHDVYHQFLAPLISNQGNTKTLDVNPKNLQFTNNAGNQLINVNANTNWSVRAAPSWITISGSTTGNNDGTFSVVVAANEGNAVREGQVIVSAADAPNRIIQVSQSAQQTKYRLSINIEGEGSVVLDPAGGEYPAGTVVRATAAPASGYQFAGWGRDASGSSLAITTTMNADQIFLASFTPINATFPVVGQYISMIADNNQYVRHDNRPVKAKVSADGTVKESVSTWKIVSGGNQNPNIYGLQASNGEYLSAEKNLGTPLLLRANFNANNRERFYIETLPGNKLLLKSVRHDQYVSLKPNGSLVADATSAGSKEEFVFELGAAQKVAETQNMALQGDIVVYPNPSNSRKFYVDLPFGWEGKPTFQMYGLLGEQMPLKRIQQVNVHTYAIELETLYKGIGLLSIRVGQDSQHTRVLFK